jgi:RNA polymerase sigma factor (sigma-70 family)
MSYTIEQTARKLAAKVNTPNADLRADLAQAGTIEGYKATAAWEPGEGKHLSSYRWTAIRRAVWREYRKNTYPEVQLTNDTPGPTDVVEVVVLMVDVQARMTRLSERQRQVAELLMAGLRPPQIAVELSLSRARIGQIIGSLRRHFEGVL